MNDRSTANHPAANDGALVVPPGVKAGPGTYVDALPLAKVRTHRNGQPRNGSTIDVSDLTPSMREHGLIHPIWVQTVKLDPPDPELGSTIFHVVVGERRTFAAHELGWQTIRAEIHDELSELDVFLIQCAENDRRRALTPLEQADAVARLMRPKSEDGFGIDDTAELAVKLAIAVPTVYRRIALARAAPEVREAFAKGELFEGSAVAIAGLAEHAAQVECLADCGPEGGEPLPVRSVISTIENRFHLRLATAPFDTTDATLVPEAGACPDCPKRTGADRQLALLPASTTAKDDRCTDRKCFGSKRLAHRDRMLAAAKDRALEVITGTSARELYPAGFLVTARAPGLVDGDSRIGRTGDGKGEGRTLRELLGAAAVFALAKALAVDSEERVHVLVEKAAIRTALEAKGIPFADDGASEVRPLPSASEGPKEEPKGKAPPEKSGEEFALSRKAQEAAGLEALGAISDAAERRKPRAGFYRVILRALLSLAPSRLEHVIERRELRTKETPKQTTDHELIVAKLDELSEDELRGLLAETSASVDGLHPGADEERHALVLGARFAGFDLSGAAKAKFAELKREAKKKLGKPDPKAPKADKAKGKAAETPAPPPFTPTPGKCSACACTEEYACQDATGPCVWADVEETLCSVCARIEAAAVEVIGASERYPESADFVMWIEVHMKDATLAKERVEKGVADAVARRKVALIDGRYRSIGTAARVVEKPATAGATPSEDIPVRTRIVRFLRARVDASATRREMLDGLAKAKPSTPAADTMREIAFMSRDKLLAVPDDVGAPIKLTGAAYEDVIAELEGLDMAKLRARWTEVFSTAAPNIGLAEARHRIAARLSGELGPETTKTRPDDPKAKPKGAKAKAVPFADGHMRPAGVLPGSPEEKKIPTKAPRVPDPGPTAGAKGGGKRAAKRKGRRG